MNEADRSLPDQSERKRFTNLTEMIEDMGLDRSVVDEHAQFEKETTLSRQLIAMRAAAGLSQTEIANKIGCSQSRISKIENARDNQLKISDVQDYARATERDVRLDFLRKHPKAVDKVKYHALSMKHYLLELAKLAHKDKELEESINAFYAEAFFNLLSIMGDCADEMPANGEPEEPRPEIYSIDERLAHMTKMSKAASSA